MKERQILFSGPMVRAILEGRKTQTRRLLKGSTEHRAPYNPAYLEAHRNSDGWKTICPHGQPGDLLWVRETWKFADWTEDGLPWIRLAADDSKLLCDRIPDDGWGEKLTDIWTDLSAEENFRIDQRAADRRWRPSIFMPRWASRLTLRITYIRVERLQEITEEDALAEGMSKGGRESCTYPFATRRDWYSALWEQINGLGSWDRNPWVWVITFERVEQQVKAA